jgi:hypothetical protein
MILQFLFDSMKKQKTKKGECSSTNVYILQLQNTHEVATLQFHGNILHMLVSKFIIFHFFGKYLDSFGKETK